MRGVLVLCLPLAGCGSYWDLRKGEELPIGCAGLLNWYLDSDGDGWGEPGSTPTPRCGPDQANQLTASNALDCDDADAGITGMAGAICPSAIGYGVDPAGSTCVAGFQSGESEFVGTCEGSPLIGFTTAQQDCTAWAGWATDEAVAEGAAGHHGLASLETNQEYEEVVTWLEGVAAGQPLALWVDLRWNGTVDSGTWEWPDGTVPTWIAPCGGEETEPVDFWPDLVVGLPESDATLQESLPEVRQALVYDGTSWCRGTPDAEGGPFGPREALALCERPQPDLGNYEDVPDDGETSPAP